MTNIEIGEVASEFCGKVSRGTNGNVPIQSVYEGLLPVLRAVASQAGGEVLSEVAKVAQAVRDRQKLAQLAVDPYARGCIDTANAIEEAVRSLKSGGA